ncbi:hypothetical protein [Mycolicibacterium sphagni]|uniref:Glycine-rich domain-containing protein n=1 Tax=Mycolicibacterium sphagni TaxID=1786 RepID=A0A255DT54_9MYCO|nr:hypothetical protein [Mycolicibacterium sphagni]OYN80415.1 hypothetical protein CG716_09800 [Mycolicibacterium sphagni]
MANLFGTWTDAAGLPCEGYLALTPRGVRDSLINEGNSAVAPKRVRIPLDHRGSFSRLVEPGDYRVDVCITDADTLSREITIPAGGDVNFKTLLAEYGPTPVDVTTMFADLGAYSFQIPWWATRVDRIIIAGGGGGADGTTIARGKGGLAGAWASDTLVRGTDIPWETAIITGSIGAGGARNGGNGGNTTAGATGAPLLTAAGGTAGAAANFHGQSPGDRTFNTHLYPGATEQAFIGAKGRSPGGGGAGGEVLNQRGGPGGAGAAWFRAYRG